MSITKLSEVTNAIVASLNQAINNEGGGTNTVVAIPPDSVSDNKLSFFLYHITEDINIRNLPPFGTGQPPVNYTPLALSLYYQLAAKYTDTTGGITIADLQDRMGYALKYLHSNPIIQINENHLTITPQRVTENASVQYWTAGTSPVNLSAYFNVSMVLL